MDSSDGTCDRECVFDFPGLVVLRGEAGAGKTAVLRALAARGARVLDLEGLAGHRGSAFGGVGLGPQPAHRVFQARCEEAARRIEGAGLVFTEHEGPYIGSVGLPPRLVRAIGRAGSIVLRAPLEARVERIAAEYGAAPAGELRRALRRVAARLGRARSAAASRALARGDVREAVRVLLPYYDAAYGHQLAQVAGPTLHVVDVAGRAEDDLAEEAQRAAEAALGRASGLALGHVLQHVET